MRTDPVFNVTFVSIIEKHPCLYASSSADYNNRAAQEKAWEAVANEVNESVSECKERWKNIRGCYTRYLKSLNASGGAGKKQPYYLAESLGFLLQYTRSRKSLDSYPSLEPSVTLEEDVTHREEDFATNSPQDFLYEHDVDLKPDVEFAQPPHKRFKLHHKEYSDYEPPPQEYYLYNKELRAEKKTEESDLAFLTSLLADMKDMNGSQKRKFKIGILNMAGQILNDASATQDDLAMTPAPSCSSSPPPRQPQ